MIDNLKDAIEHATRVARNLKAEAKAWQGCAIQSKGKVKANECLECAADHERLAEWLIELNNYRQSKSGCSKCKYNGDIGGDYIRYAQTTEGTIYKNKYDGSLRFVKKNPKCVGCCTTVSRHFEPKAPESEAENESETLHL